MTHPDMSAWLKTRPECVQKLAAEFPVTTVVEMDGLRYFLIGYNESDGLLLSTTDPRVDYEKAKATRVILCASHLRDLPGS